MIVPGALRHAAGEIMDGAVRLPGRGRRVVFRADADRQIGGGHVKRCLTLAEYLAADGWSVGFASLAETKAIVPQFHDKVELLEATDLGQLDAHALAQRWPGGCDVLVVDHYGLDAEFETACRGWAKRLIVIDDLANRPHDCDCLVDSTPGRTFSDYTPFIQPNAMLLTGPDYALLRPEFAAWRERALVMRDGRATPSRVLVSLGLTDLGGITERVVRALLPLGSMFSIDVVIGAAAQSRRALGTLAALEPQLSLLIDPPDMAALMATADLAIGAGGTTSWERCCLGLPTVLLVLADNQKLVAQRLANLGAAIVAPLPEDPRFPKLVAGLLKDTSHLKAIAAAAAKVTDGRGAQRIAFTLSGPGASERGGLEMRLATADDSEAIWTWRNDPISRANSCDSSFVSRHDHDRWFTASLSNPCRVLLVGIMGSELVGVVRFDRHSGVDLEVSINLAPAQRGRGLGLALLRSACSIADEGLKDFNLYAVIKEENVASRRIFEACGFDLMPYSKALGHYQRVRARPRSSNSC